MALSKALIKVYLYPHMKNSCKKVKLLFVLPALVSGGAERVLINLMNATDEGKYDRALLTVKNDGELGSLVAADVPLHRLGLRHFIFCLPALYKKLRELSPDIVASTMTHMNFALLLLRPFFPRTRFLVREAITPSYFLEKYAMAGGLIKFLYRWLYPRADLVFGPSNAIFREFNELFGRDWVKSCVLRNPVAGDEIRAAADGQFPSFADGVRFVACGRLVPQKGFDRLIETLAKMPAPQDWHLTILGEGPQRPELESLIAACELNDRIALPGLQMNPYAYFAAADCLLLPSRFEGLPNVVLESLACGTPVIATRESGGIAEIAASLNADRKGAVTVVNDMAEFASTYCAVTAGRKRALSPSLLPLEYEKDAVLRSFEAILDDVQRP